MSGLKSKPKKIALGTVFVTLVMVVGFVNDIGGIKSWLLPSTASTTKDQVIKDNVGTVQEASGSSSVQSVTITGDNNTLTVPTVAGEVKGATAFDVSSFVFKSDLRDANDWIAGKNVKLRNNILSYSGRGNPGFFLTKLSFSQDNTFVVSFISHTKAPDLIIRLKDILDARIGDGGPTEAALHRFSSEGNWPEVPLDNPNVDRETRWKFPCPLPLGKEIKITLQIAAFGANRKAVTMYYEYQCQDGHYISQQDENYGPAFWTFTLPDRPNIPTQLGIGLNDPSGKDKPRIETLSVNIEHE